MEKLKGFVRYELEIERASNCSEIENHTSCPTDYLGWHEWAEKMDSKGFIQKKCPACGFYAIWKLPEVGVSLTS